MNSVHVVSSRTRELVGVMVGIKRWEGYIRKVLLGEVLESWLLWDRVLNICGQEPGLLWEADGWCGEGMGVLQCEVDRNAAGHKKAE